MLKHYKLKLSVKKKNELAIIRRGGGWRQEIRQIARGEKVFPEAFTTSNQTEPS